MTSAPLYARTLSVSERSLRSKNRFPSIPSRLARDKTSSQRETELLALVRILSPTSKPFSSSSLTAPRTFWAGNREGQSGPMYRRLYSCLPPSFVTSRPPLDGRYSSQSIGGLTIILRIPGPRSLSHRPIHGVVNALAPRKRV